MTKYRIKFHENQYTVQYRWFGIWRTVNYYESSHVPRYFTLEEAKKYIDIKLKVENILKEKPIYIKYP